MLIVFWTSELVYVQSFSEFEKKSFLLHLERPVDMGFQQPQNHNELRNVF